MEDQTPRAITCCFTGHRPAKLPWHSDEEDPRCLALLKKLDDVLDALYLSGLRHFLCGMALGADTYFAEAVLRLRASHEDVTLEAAVPCLSQCDRWNHADIARYRRLLDACDRVTVLQDDYSPGCMQRRNRYMAERSSVMVAVFDGSDGGTKNTVSFCRKLGCEMILIQP